MTCDFKNECTSQYRRVFYEIHDPDIEKIRKYYYSDEGQDIYFLRGHFAETTFALMMEIRNFRGIKTRGLKKANNELTIEEIYHNIRKLEKHTTVTFLKLLYNMCKNEIKTNGKIDFTFLRKFKDRFIKKDDILRGIRDD